MKVLGILTGLVVALLGILAYEGLRKVFAREEGRDV